MIVVRNETQQNATDQPLRPVQALVLGEIALGRSVTAATRAAGVDRSCYYRWEKDDPNFAAALFQAKIACGDELRAQVRALATDAIAALRETLTGQDVPAAIRLAAAKEVLNVAGALGREVVRGNADPAECALTIENDKIRRAVIRRSLETDRRAFELQQSHSGQASEGWLHNVSRV